MPSRHVGPNLRQGRIKRIHLTKYYSGGVGNDGKSIHWDLVTYICVNNLTHHSFRYRLVAYSVPSHYLNQCCYLVDWTVKSEIWIENQTFSLKKLHLKTLSAKWWPFCFTPNVSSMTFHKAVGECWLIINSINTIPDIYHTIFNSKLCFLISHYALKVLPHCSMLTLLYA